MKAIAYHTAILLLIMVTISATLIIYFVFQHMVPGEEEYSPAERTTSILRVDQGESWKAIGLEINVTNPHATPLSDYQVRVTLDAANFDNWSLLSPGRVYFTQDAGGSTPLYSWVEEIQPSIPRAVLWVRVPSLPASGNATVYMWLSPTNPYTAYSDPSRVFEFFVHFNAPTLDPTLWNNVYLTGYSISNSVLTIDVGGLILASPLPFNVNDGYAGEVRVRMTLNANAYSGTLPEFSSSPSTRGSNADSDATVLYMRGVNSQNLVVFIGDGSTNSYNIVPGAVVASTIDGSWYLAGVGVNSTSVALWLNDPQAPVVQYGGITWAKNMRYLVLGAFNAADGGASYDIQDTEYDWVRVRKWFSPSPPQR